MRVFLEDISLRVARPRRNLESMHVENWNSKVLSRSSANQELTKHGSVHPLLMTFGNLIVSVFELCAASCLRVLDESFSRDTLTRVGLACQAEFF